MGGARLRAYEQERKKRIDDDLKCAVVVEMMPGQLKHHLQLNARALNTYEQIRAEIVGYLEARQTPSGATPMDVGASEQGKGGYTGKG